MAKPLARRKESKGPLYSLTSSFHGVGQVAELGERVGVIRKGFTWSEAHRFQETFELRDQTFAHLLGLSNRTLTRVRRTRKALDPVASDRLYRLARIFQLAANVFENNEKAMAWLSRPQVGLADKTPLDLLDTEPGAEAVESLLGQIEYGVIS